jgi:hypothetical protein
MKLYSMLEMAKMENVTTDAIKQRINVRGLKPYVIKNQVYYFTEKQKDLIMEKRKETVYLTQKFIIRESKINRPRNTYGTHSHFNRKRV